MAVCNNLDKLRPDLKTAFLELKKRVKETYNADIIAFETYRPEIIQKAYYAQGRKTLEETNMIRKIAGLYLLTEAENKKIITYSDTATYHGTGRAFDIVPVRYDGKKQILWWAAPPALWAGIGKIGKELGLVWGGDFVENGKPMKDHGHFQKE